MQAVCQIFYEYKQLIFIYLIKNRVQILRGFPHSENKVRHPAHRSPLARYHRVANQTLPRFRQKKQRAKTECWPFG
ncbi:hypothetical protein BIY27_15185 [Gibbsiella quercinecans]|nr:hypothetical protein BIY27_15185 [Gibbsiella quercinecans]